MSDTEATPGCPDLPPFAATVEFWGTALADPEWFVTVVAPQLMGALYALRSRGADIAADTLDTVGRTMEQKRAKLPRRKR
jgi:hypothetical protein